MGEHSNYYENKADLVSRARDIVTEAKAATEREIQAYKRAHAMASVGPHGAAYTPMRFVNPDTQEIMSEDEFRGWLDDQFEAIPRWFDSRGQPEPNDFKDVTASLDSVQNTFGGSNGASENPNLGAAEDAKDELDEWSGVFAENLRDSMLAPMDTISHNHGKIAKMLYDVVKGSENIYRGQRRDLSEVANKTIEALRTCDEKDGDDLRLGLTVLTSLTAIAAAVLAVPTAGLSAKLWIYGATITLSTISGTTFVSKETIRHDDYKIGGKTVNQVLDNMWQRLSDIDQAVAKEEDKVIEVLSTNYEILTAIRQLGNTTRKATPITPMRPTIADAEKPHKGLAPEHDQQ